MNSDKAMLQYTQELPNGYRWLHKAGPYHKFTNGYKCILVTDKELVNGAAWRMLVNDDSQPDHTCHIDKYNHGLGC